MFTRFIVSVICGLVLVVSASATDIAARIKSCEGCHGPDGVSSQPMVPTIAGISEGVHADALYLYRDGTRPCEGAPLRGAMCSAVKGLSDEQIEALASHYAAKPFVPATQEVDTEKAAAGAAIHAAKCEICHSGGGSEAAADASILAGQWMGYLRTALKEYKAGERDQLPAMKAKIEKLTPEECEALVHFYGSQK